MTEQVSVQFPDGGQEDMRLMDTHTGCWRNLNYDLDTLLFLMSQEEKAKLYIFSNCKIENVHITR